MKRILILGVAILCLFASQLACSDSIILRCDDPQCYANQNCILCQEK